MIWKGVPDQDIKKVLKLTNIVAQNMLERMNLIESVYDFVCNKCFELVLYFHSFERQ